MSPNQVSMAIERKELGLVVFSLFSREYMIEESDWTFQDWV